MTKIIAALFQPQPSLSRPSRRSLIIITIVEWITTITTKN
jgi:hypothetical protein